MIGFLPNFGSRPSALEWSVSGSSSAADYVLWRGRTDHFPGRARVVDRCLWRTAPRAPKTARVFGRRCEGFPCFQRPLPAAFAARRQRNRSALRSADALRECTPAISWLLARSSADQCVLWRARRRSVQRTGPPADGRLPSPSRHRFPPTHEQWRGVPQGGLSATQH